MKIVSRSDIPNHNSFEEFVVWYFNGGIKFYLDHGVFSTIMIGTNTSETIIFSHKQFQVELYVVNRSDDFYIEQHTHPNVRTFEYLVTPNSVKTEVTSEYVRNNISQPGVPHGGKISKLNVYGYFFIVCQEWLGNKKGHISILDYVGPSVGPLHEKLLQARNPQALTLDSIVNSTGTRILVDTTKGIL